MFVELFPIAHARYQSLPLLGPHVEEFVGWLESRGFTAHSRGDPVAAATTRSRLRSCGAGPGMRSQLSRSKSPAKSTSCSMRWRPLD